MGFFHASRLSLIIAAVEIGRSEGLISETLYSSFIFLAIVSAIMGPLAGKHILGETPSVESVCRDEDYMYGI
jgi:hypothetical protein